ncbi:uncharacterized protein LOC134222346 [Armigeres subalbatus]|uniref:uncharacterized protein LOC134222346 n=1 Tax=Armigeres subalbatus TaxID=124917 RepID=UPI002ED0B137
MCPYHVEQRSPIGKPPVNRRSVGHYAFRTPPENPPSSAPTGVPPALQKSCAGRYVKKPFRWHGKQLPLFQFTNPVIQTKCLTGVSILCCLSKVFEKLIYNVLYTVASPIISDSQHGFMKNRSTTTNLMCYVSALSREMEKGRQIDAIYVDYAKAFDTVPHNLVIEKLEHIGFPSWITEWIASYLPSRSAYVVVNSRRSQFFDITSGFLKGVFLDH